VQTLDDNAARGAKMVTTIEVKPQEFRNGKDILPVGNDSQV
jgi:hypothetical protein